MKFQTVKTVAADKVAVKTMTRTQDDSAFEPMLAAVTNLAPGKAVTIAVDVSDEDDKELALRKARRLVAAVINRNGHKETHVAKLAVDADGTPTGVAIFHRPVLTDEQLERREARRVKRAAQRAAREG